MNDTYTHLPSVCEIKKKVGKGILAALMCVHSDLPRVYDRGKIPYSLFFNQALCVYLVQINLLCLWHMHDHAACVTDQIREGM